jgi:phosphatidylglycerophosphate synthase
VATSTTSPTGPTGPTGPTVSLGAAAARVVPKINPANAVTASRFLTLPPFTWAVANGYRQHAILFLLICGLLDKVDGLVARIFDCRSPFGELFDAITDGACYGYILVALIAYGWAPWLPCGLVLGLGLLNSGLRLAYARRARRSINYKSYAMERIVAYTAYLAAFAICQYEVTYFYWAFLPIMGVIVLHDGKRMLLDPLPPAPGVGGGGAS